MTTNKSGRQRSAVRMTDTYLCHRCQKATLSCCIAALRATDDISHDTKGKFRFFVWNNAIFRIFSVRNGPYVTRYRLITIQPPTPNKPCVPLGVKKQIYPKIIDAPTCKCQNNYAAVGHNKICLSLCEGNIYKLV